MGRGYAGPIGERSLGPMAIAFGLSFSLDAGLIVAIVKK